MYKYNNTGEIKIRRIFYYIDSLIKLYKALTPGQLLHFIRMLFLPDIKTLKLKRYNLQFKLKTLLDILTLKEVVIDEEYENCGVKTDKNDKVVVDIGAGFGDFSVLTAKKFPQAKIFAFEPDPFYFCLLRDNIRLNKVGNIFIYKKAITSLEQVSHLISSTKIDFLKMDCEGCEFEIINKGLPNLYRVGKLVLEYHENKNHQVSKIVSILEKTGFKVKFYPRKQIENIGLLVATAL